MRLKSFIIAFALIVLLLTIFVYLVNFHNVPFSGKTSDWGAFGSYLGIGIGAMSIALIYVTYNEQRQSNQITRFEQHIYTMQNTLEELINKKKTTIDDSFNKFIAHFAVQIYDLSSCKKTNIEGVCTYYYSSIMYGNNDSFYYLFRYLDEVLSYIQQEENISDKEKSRRIVEFACALPESVRILYFCWKLTDKKDLLEYGYKKGFFMLGEPKNYLLEDIITYTCTGKLPTIKRSKDSDPKNIELEDYPNEQFHDTYERLYNTKTKQQ